MLGELIQKEWSIEQQYQASTLDPNLLPKTSTNCFKVNPLLAHAVKIIDNHDWTLPIPLAGDSKKAAHDQNHIQYRNWADKSPSGKRCNKESKAPNVNSCGDDAYSSSDEECHGGFFLQSMNEDIEWTFKIHEHAKTCRGTFSPVVHTKKKGWEMQFEYTCLFCKQTFLKQSAPHLDAPQTKPGPKPSSININLAVAIYVSGITVEKALVLFAEARVVAPMRKSLDHMLEKVKGAAQYLSEGKLNENQKEHIKACQETVGYKGNIKWTNNISLKHSFALSASAADGGGEHCAYNHHILGTQHVLIVFSLVTGKPLYMKHDQISCKKCSLALTKRMGEEWLPKECRGNWCTSNRTCR
jgi:hypothetical protein